MPTASKRRNTLFASILVAVTTAITLVACEALLRAALFSDTFAVQQLRQPFRFADSTMDENFWRLLVVWGGSDDLATDPAGRLHPRLGWAPLVTDSNPLGLISEHPYTLAELESPILFYGDSFVAGAGATRVAFRIPQLLDEKTDRRVLNYGVGGYGLDQVYLRMSDTLEQFSDPTVIVGVLMEDLDRVVVGLRGGVKPHYELADDGQLVLHHVPVTELPAEYVARNPPDITSYLWRFGVFRLRGVLAPSTFNALLGYDAVQARKEALDRALLARFKTDAEASGAPLYVVLFYSREEVQRPQEWREQLLKSTLTELGVEFFDTKEYLLDYLSRTGVPIDTIYYPVNNHLNETGNTIVAEGLAEWLRHRGALD